MVEYNRFADEDDIAMFKKAGRYFIKFLLAMVSLSVFSVYVEYRYDLYYYSNHCQNSLKTDKNLENLERFFEIKSSTPKHTRNQH